MLTKQLYEAWYQKKKKIGNLWSYLYFLYSGLKWFFFYCNLWFFCLSAFRLVITALETRVFGQKSQHIRVIICFFFFLAWQGVCQVRWSPWLVAAVSRWHSCLCPCHSLHRQEIQSLLSWQMCESSTFSKCRSQGDEEKNGRNCRGKWS